MEQMVGLNKQKTLKSITEAGILASKIGTKIIGLGAYAALLGGHGLEIAKKVGVPVTTGAACTLATIPESIFRAADLMEKPIEESTVLIVGATNNIGKICIEVLGRSAKTLILASRSIERLDETIKTHAKYAKANIIKKIGDIRNDAIQADIIIYATNLSLLPFDLQSLKPGTIIFDASYPRKISNALRNDILVIDGLAIKPPGNPEFSFDFGLPPGLAYPCMVEPIILAFEGRFESYSLGKEISTHKAMEMIGLMTKHGFRITELTSMGRVFSKENIQHVKDRITIQKKSHHSVF
jgi:predicted amino acid dehydrogenase